MPLDCGSLLPLFISQPAGSQEIEHLSKTRRSTRSRSRLRLPKSGRRLPQSKEKLPLPRVSFCPSYHVMSAVNTLPSSDDCAKGTRHWPHAPPHRLESAGVYFVTARTAEQRHLLAESEMKDWFQDKLLELATHFDWRLEAWAIFSNHYHFIAHRPPLIVDAASLREMIRKLHSLTTKELNRRENRSGRTRLWQNFRETQLTHQRSYLARLNYVHQNAVHHKLVNIASDWKWCSAQFFEQAVTPAWFKTISSFKYDEIAGRDGDI